MVEGTKVLFITDNHICMYVTATAMLYRVIQNDGLGFNNLSYIIHLRQEYVVAPLDQEILKVFFYDVWCAVGMHY
jgi:hypothetical protein